VQVLIAIAVEVLLIRYIIDVMHYERNLCENIVKTIMGKKDSLGSRQDMQDLDIRRELWLNEPRRRGDSFFMPEPIFILSAVEKANFLSVLEKLKTPTNYVSALHKRVADGKLRYMKSHDFHVLMQQVWKDNYITLLLKA
jgi:hypothetical protein